jgi:hypothetical protein
VVAGSARGHRLMSVQLTTTLLQLQRRGKGPQVQPLASHQGPPLRCSLALSASMNNSAAVSCRTC